MKRNEAKVHQWNAADAVTSARIAASLLLLFLPLQSAGFFAVYFAAGITDVLDGWLARKTGTASSFGARLDSVADLLFYGIILVRLFPVLWKALPVAIWYAVAAVLLVRLSAYITAAVKYRRFAALHTWLNKLIGAALFLLPCAMAVSAGIVYSWTICILAFAAALEELLMHLLQKEYFPDRKSIFQNKPQHDMEILDKEN